MTDYGSSKSSGSVSDGSGSGSIGSGSDSGGTDIFSTDSRSSDSGSSDSRSSDSGSSDSGFSAYHGFAVTARASGLRLPSEDLFGVVQFGVHELWYGGFSQTA